MEQKAAEGHKFQFFPYWLGAAPAGGFLGFGFFVFSARRRGVFFSAVRLVRFFRLFGCDDAGAAAGGGGMSVANGTRADAVPNDGNANKIFQTKFFPSFGCDDAGAAAGGGGMSVANGTRADAVPNDDNANKKTPDTGGNKFLNIYSTKTVRPIIFNIFNQIHHIGIFISRY